MNEFTLTGTVLSVSPLHYRGSEGQYQVCNVVIDISEINPNTGMPYRKNTPEIEFFGKAAETWCPRLQVGKIATIQCNADGTEYISRKTGEKAYFTKIRGYGVLGLEQPEQPKVEHVGGMPYPRKPATPRVYTEQMTFSNSGRPEPMTSNEDDDLPF